MQPAAPRGSVGDQSEDAVPGLDSEPADLAFEAERPRDEPNAPRVPGEVPDGAGGAGESGVRTVDKVTICHRTNSETNPFVAITVSENALSGHLNHPEDVIPPTASQPGQNWPSDLVDETCSPLTPTPTVPPVEPTSTVPPVEPTVPPVEPTSTVPPVEPTSTVPPVRPPVEPTVPPVRPPVEPIPSPTAQPSATTTVNPKPETGGVGGSNDDSGEELAETGASTGRHVVLAAVLLALGAAFTAGSRRLDSAD